MYEVFPNRIVSSSSGIRPWIGRNFELFGSCHAVCRGSRTLATHLVRPADRPRRVDLCVGSIVVSPQNAMPLVTIVSSPSAINVGDEATSSVAIGTRTIRPRGAPVSVTTYRSILPAKDSLLDAIAERTELSPLAVDDSQMMRKLTAVPFLDGR